MIELILGDITKQEKFEAIVNAANNTLLGGGGVDGAIHRMAGPELLEECIILNGCNTGEAKLTGAYNLPNKYIIHTVGPIWHGGGNDEAGLLRLCYEHILDIVVKKQIKSVAIPSISTGKYKCPVRFAAMIAYETVTEYMWEHKLVDEILVAWVLFDKKTYTIYNDIIGHGNKIIEY